MAVAVAITVVVAITVTIAIAGPNNAPSRYFSLTQQ